VDKIKDLYFPKPGEKELKRVTGLGGFFFRAKDSKGLTSWYKKHLGLNTDDYGWTFWWKDAEGNDGSTQWSVMKEETSYFNPSEKQFMQNFRVHDLDSLLEKLRLE